MTALKWKKVRAYANVRVSLFVLSLWSCLVFYMNSEVCYASGYKQTTDQQIFETCLFQLYMSPSPLLAPPRRAAYPDEVNCSLRCTWPGKVVLKSREASGMGLLVLLPLRLGFYSLVCMSYINEAHGFYCFKGVLFSVVDLGQWWTVVHPIGLFKDGA